ncbi:hypothetical protein [Mesorhizobium sp. dw_380]|uniref:hypothetical protein n=1 Tax=Mesorhizobium sp. dw_380 TaxID=2812001 RepID=UPI001BDE9BC1|nr:hypothetical protein [Mesorhizobium sp. dw_380]
MSNRETARSHALGMRVAELKTRMQEARITEGEIKTFQKVAAMMEDDQGRIDGDDLIAASFVTDTLLDKETP